MARSQDPFGTELRRFIDTMDKRQFRAAHIGFGYADVKEKKEPAIPSRYEPARVVRKLEWQPVPHQPLPTEPVIFTATAVSHAQPLGSQWVESVHRELMILGEGVVRVVKSVMAHVVDLSVVCLTVAGSLIFAAIFLAPARSEGIVQTLLHWEMLSVIRELTLIWVIVFVYVLFAVYWCVMRFVAGQTLGHTLMRNARPQSR